ncbi:tigger transposable element-derived protein 1-like [Palaemon carinicauda]|uniref:tigger transposable element-derived protein 1-like n=1 Tax=Palaemon carinicauda TaxID=392227 RepID=UPI0035B597EC
MAPKHPLPSTSSSERKKKRKMMTVNEKVKLLDMLKTGSRYSSVARIYGRSFVWGGCLGRPTGSSSLRRGRVLKFIKEGDYLLEVVLNMDETGLVWNRMPSRTFLYKDEVKKPGFKAHKDCDTLLMCGNAAGFMFKPSLIYKSVNPRALKNKNKILRPVYWMSNKKAWITKALSLDWFVNCFVTQVKLYLADNGLPFEVLHLMDWAGGHAMDMHYDRVQMEFLPPHTPLPSYNQ